MSKSSRSSELKLPQVVEKVGLKTFEDVAIAILELMRSGEARFDVSASRFLIGVSEEDRDQIAKEYRIDDSTIENIMDSLARVFRSILTRDTDKVTTEFGKDRKSVDRGAQVLDIGTRLLQKYPQIRDRFLITSFAKTRYLEDLDWEVCIKAAEHPSYDFSKEDRFTACTLRFILAKPLSAVHPVKYGEGVTDAVFEVSLEDVNRMIAALSAVRDKMKEVGKEIRR